MEHGPRFPLREPDHLREFVALVVRGPRGGRSDRGGVRVAHEGSDDGAATTLPFAATQWCVTGGTRARPLGAAPVSGRRRHDPYPVR
jgi:hypothetical protein